MLFSYMCVCVGFFLLFFFNVYYLFVFMMLELTLLGVFGSLVLGTSRFFNFSTVLSFLLILVCVGGFSVSLLVFLSRGAGKDFWLSMNFI